MTNGEAMPPLTALRAFLAAGQQGSFQSAAQELGVTPSAISHQVRTLEAWLGVPLFVRTARQVTLTAKGRRFLRDIEGAFGKIRLSAERMRGRGTKTTLRVSALPLFTSAWLIPRLADFEARHPDITLAIETTNRIVDLERDGVDVGIRNLRAPTPGLVVKKLLDVRAVPLVARKLAPQLRRPQDLAQQTLIHISARPESWREWLKAAGLGDLKPKKELTFDTVPAALEAAARGYGVTLGMHPLVWESQAAASLVVPFAAKASVSSSYYLVHRKHDGSRAEVRAFVDWLTGEMARFVRTRPQVPVSARARAN
ncbi:MAG: LysR family transcriptional regulator [Alphaproteobacteria bacterium]|nr:LysR family transcriptional regulator [Alphaproteobacteria bacterium]